MSAPPVKKAKMELESPRLTHLAKFKCDVAEHVSPGSRHGCRIAVKVMVVNVEHIISLPL